MSIVAIVALIDGIITLAIRLMDAFQSDASLTPEQKAEALAALKVRLAETAAKVDAWTPKA